jgi:hypothetical protein
MDAPEGPVLALSGTNNTDVDIDVTVRHCSVNDIMVDPAFEMRLAARGNQTAEAVFPKKLLLAASIQTFANISFVVRMADVSDSEKYIDAKPFDLPTSMSGKYTQKYVFPGSLVVESKGIKIMIGRVADAEGIMGKQIYIYIDNASPNDINVEAKETEANGIKIDPLFYKAVGAYKKSWAPLVFLDTDIVTNGIESIDKLIISFRVISIYGIIIDTGRYQVLFDPVSA